MLGKKILTRLTRLGLAVYAMTWCMSFTVCAEENPIGDMMIGDYSAGSGYEQEDFSELSVDESWSELPVFTEESIAEEEETISDITDDGEEAVFGDEPSIAPKDPEPGVDPYEPASENNAPTGLGNGTSVTLYPNQLFLSPAKRYVLLDGANRTISFNISGTDADGHPKTTFNDSEAPVFAGFFSDENHTNPMDSSSGVVSQNLSSTGDNQYTLSITIRTGDFETGIPFYVAVKRSYNAGNEENPDQQVAWAVGKVNCYKAVEEIGITPLDGTGSTITDMTAINRFKVDVVNAVPPADVELDPEKFVWTVDVCDEEEGLWSSITPGDISGDVYWTVDKDMSEPDRDKGTVLNISFPGVTEKQKFTLRAQYNENGGPSFLVDEYNLTVNPYCYSVSGLDLNDYAVPEPPANLTYQLKSADPSNGILDPSRIRWGLIEDGSTDTSAKNVRTELGGIRISKSYWDPRTGSVDACNVEQSVNVTVVAKYYNTDPSSFEDALFAAEDEEAEEAAYALEPEYVVKTSRLSIIVPEFEVEGLEAHLPEKTAKILIYKKENLIPVSFRYENLSSAEVLEYEISGAEFLNENLSEVFNITVADSGDALVVSTRDNYIKENTTLLPMLLKSKKITTGLRVWLDGADQPLLTKENLTITLSDAGPAVKAANTLNFNSFKAGYETLELEFTGAEVDRVEPYGTVPKGLVVDYYRINSTRELPAKVKKGKFNVLAYVDDDDWNLPEGYAVKVPITYTVKNAAPVITLPQKNVILNTFTNDMYNASLNVSGSVVANTKIKYTIQNANKKTLNDTVLSVSPNYSFNGTAIVNAKVGIHATGETLPGMTYRVNFFAENEDTGRKGPASTIIVKTPAEKDAKNPVLSIKGSGAIDISDPDSTLALEITGKNFHRNSLPNVGYHIYIQGIEGEVTDAFNVISGGPGPLGRNKMFIEMNNSNIAFVMTEEKLAGKKLTVNITYQIGVDQFINGSYTTKLKQSTLKPKIGIKKVAINPEYNNNTINIPITGVDTEYYRYEVSVDCGKGISSPFNGIVEDNPILSKTVVSLNVSTPGLKSLYGKTCTLKVKPVGFVTSSEEEGAGLTDKLPSKTATCKITVLNPGKSKNAISASVKVNGTIDSVRDSSFALGKISYKNADGDSLNVTGVNRINVTTTVKKKQTDCTDLFDVDLFLAASAGSVKVTRAEGKDVPAGTYKANLEIEIVPAGRESDTKVIPATMTFKVVRGKKTGVKITPAEAKLVNRDFGRKVKFNLSVADSSVNDVVNVTLSKNYQDKFVLTEDTSNDGIYYLRMKPGYVEKLKKKPISKFRLYKKVPFEVYYKGSPVPDKVNLKLILNP
ncbi:MAG: hypothetical protein K6F53_02600 [Lachnospiraceae bacterium]|nr:hypothetical protein [Lachnospiraceae bacterium]